MVHSSAMVHFSTRFLSSREVMRFPEGHTSLLFGHNEISLCRNDSILCPNDGIFCPNDGILCPNDLILFLNERHFSKIVVAKGGGGVGNL